ncbi:omega-amidase NIT2 [Schistocerca cancellata]|uniref:omega-amidase NIT2 n=1 Tax=Schistocerca cancellata TaxID=274614 RepID=UPI002119622E|nr:omega-amidase NIT2 [Schistocerca cancellata]
MSSNKFRIALVQLVVGGTKENNVKKAIDFIKQAKEKGSDVVILPECFNSPYGTKYFSSYAEEIPSGETSKALSQAAKENNVYLIGGSIPERDGNKLYNTCTIWNRSGQMVAKHRKVHLFDIDIPGGITFKESETLSPGNQLTIFETEMCKIGVGICYDIRFEEMARIYRNMGCQLLVYPGAFNMTTGPLHWQLLQRARAVDNQVYVAGVAPLTEKGSDYTSWGHSTLVDPWGKVVVEGEFSEEILYGDIDLSTVKEVRQQIPISLQRRTDLYDTVKKGGI